MKFRFDKNVSALLEGSIDIHIHSAPYVYPRLLNDVELPLREGKRHAGDSGEKSLFRDGGTRTACDRCRGLSRFRGHRAQSHQRRTEQARGQDGAEDGGQRGLDAHRACRLFRQNKSHVANLATEIGDDVQGLVLVKEDGTLKDELYEIFDIIREADAIFATGHVTKEEAKLAVREAAKRGVKKIIVTHPAATFVHYSVDDMKEILELGATFLEHTWNDVTRQVSHPLQISALFDIIKAVGAAHSIMSTDAGQWLNPPAAQQMGIYIKEALMSGISAKDVRMMVADNPAKILGI